MGKDNLMPLYMYKVIFTDARDRLIYHRKTRIVYLRNLQSVINAVDAYGNDYATVHIQVK